jgi:hypothetical protein
MRVCVSACVLLAQHTLVCACFVVACVGVLVRAPACIEAAPPSPMHTRARAHIARCFRKQPQRHGIYGCIAAREDGERRRRGAPRAGGQNSHGLGERAAAPCRGAALYAAQPLGPQSRAYVHMNARTNEWCARPHLHARWYRDSARVRSHRHAAAAYLHRTKAACPYCSCLEVRTIRRR